MAPQLWPHSASQTFRSPDAAGWPGRSGMRPRFCLSNNLPGLADSDAAAAASRPPFENHCSRQGCQTHFHRGHISLAVAFKGPSVTLGLYKYNYSLTRGKELGAATGQKEGGGPDSARGPCVCCLCSTVFLEKFICGLGYLGHLG